MVVGPDAGAPPDEQAAAGNRILSTCQLKPRFVTLPNSDHPTIPGTLELVGTVTTWLREILTASSRLGSRPAAASIEERNTASGLLMEAADVPKYNWTISASGEEITVMADR